MGKLAAMLRKVDDVAVPLAKKSFAPPAKAKDLDALARDACGGTLPAELREWFAWHDGQRSVTPLDDNNFTAMSVWAVRATYRRLNDPDEDALRPKPTWVPLFENGGGDYLMYELVGPRRGALMVYRHDDERWPRAPEYASLAAWSGCVVKHQQKLARAKKRKLPFELSALRWQSIARVPPLDKVPVGTALRVAFRRDWIAVHLKTADDVWYWNAAETYEGAIAELVDELTKRSSDFRCDVAEIRDSLSKLDAKQRATLARSLAPLPDAV